MVITDLRIYYSACKCIWRKQTAFHIKYLIHIYIFFKLLAHHWLRFSNSHCLISCKISLYYISINWLMHFPLARLNHLSYWKYSRLRTCRETELVKIQVGFISWPQCSVGHLGSWMGPLENQLSGRKRNSAVRESIQPGLKRLTIRLRK